MNGVVIMNIDGWDSVLVELTKASPYAVLLVFGFLLFYFMFRRSMKDIRELSERSIQEIRLAYSDSSGQVSSFMLLMKEGNKR